MDIRTIEAISTTLDGIGDAQDCEITRDYIDDLRRQLAHMTAWRDAAIVDGNEARSEAAALRRQLHARIVAADRAVADARRERDDLRRQLTEAQAQAARLRDEVLLLRGDTAKGE